MPQKLELTWIGKNDPKNQISPEPRILIHNEEYSCGDQNTENMLIHGDNLLALKALEQKYTGQIKCIYIDPPYNTGSAFEHYDDNLEHSIWLNLMKPRIELLRNLLSEDGSIWISIDDDEQAYLKVLCDEVFGRNNFVNNVIWQKKYSPQNDAKWLSDNHDYIMVYTKNKNRWRPNLLPRSDKQNKYYKYDDNDGRGLWRSDNITVKRVTPKDVYEIITPTGKKVLPPPGTSWRFSKEKFQVMLKENRIYFGPTGDGSPSVKRYLNEVKDGVTSLTLWTYEEVGHTQDAKREVIKFNDRDVFETPKPERLIERIITLGSNSGDLILDSFLGSGTTAAVAHKMGRKWIGIELGEHAKTHCYPRLKAVVEGEQGGISKSVDWNGGGGFKFYELAPSLLKEDKYGNLVTNEKYDSEMLAEAMTKHQSFKYSPDPDVFWKQGYSYEKDYIFTTTQFVTHEFLNLIHQDMTGDESLLICCKAFAEGAEELYENINIKKIPQAILDKCEFGRDDYSLNVFESAGNTEETDDNEELLE